MFRSTIAVVGGYAVMAAWVMITLGVAFIILGENFVFRTGTNTVTGQWLAVEMTLALIGALMGGMTAALISRNHSPQPVRVLAGLVLLLGMTMGIMQQLMTDTGPARMTGNTGTAEVVALNEPDEPEQPAWHAFALPVIGCTGVIAGGRFISSRND